MNENILHSLELIQNEKNLQKEVLKNEFGNLASNMKFTDFSTKFSQIQGEKSELKNNIMEIIRELDDKYSLNYYEKCATSLTTGFYLNRSGQENSHATGSITDYFSVIPGETIYVTGHSQQNGYLYVLFDSDKKAVSYFPNVENNITENPSSFFSYHKVNIPDGVKYIRVSAVSNATTPSIYKVQNLKFVDEIIDVIFSNEGYINQTLSFGKFFESEAGTNDGYYLNQQGIETSYENGSVTNFVKVNPGQHVLVSGQASNQGYLYCLYDEEKNLISKYPNVKPGADTNPQLIVRDMDVVIPENVSYIRSSSVWKPTIDAKIKTQNNLRYIEELINKFVSLKEENAISSLSSEYYLNPYGGETASASFCYSNFIDLRKYKSLTVSTYARWNTIGMQIFDSNKKYLSASLSANGDECITINEEISLDKITSSNPKLINAAYIRLGGMTNRPPEAIGLTEYTANDRLDRLEMMINEISPVQPENVDKLVSAIHNSDPLYGKKYISLGDSYTEGDFSGYVDSEGLTGKSSDAYDSTMGMYKTYPWHIATRHNMNLTNDAKCGATMTDIGLSTGTTAVCNRLNAISSQISVADYMTIAIGINDGGRNAEIGVQSDSSLSTLWGAFNSSLSSILTWNPGLKIGMIINTSNSNVRTAEIEIAKYWGIPYFDLYGDDKITALDGRVGFIMNQFAVQQRRKAYKLQGAVTSDGKTNGHPSVEGNRLLSYSIEHFMKSL